MCTEHERSPNCGDLDTPEEYLTGLLEFMQRGGKLFSIPATVNCLMARVEYTQKDTADKLEEVRRLTNKHKYGYISSGRLVCILEGCCNGEQGS